MTAGLDPGYDVGLMSTGPDVEIYTALAKGQQCELCTSGAADDGADNIVPVGIDLKKEAR